MREHSREESVLDLHIFCRFDFLWKCRDSSKPITGFSEGLDLSLHMDSVYLAKQHLRHQDVLLIPLGKVLGYSEGTVALTAGRRVFMFVHARMDSIQPLFLTDSATIPVLFLPLSLCDLQIRKWL